MRTSRPLLNKKRIEEVFERAKKAHKKAGFELIMINKIGDWVMIFFN